MYTHVHMCVYIRTYYISNTACHYVTKVAYWIAVRAGELGGIEWIFNDYLYFNEHIAFPCAEWRTSLI